MKVRDIMERNVVTISEHATYEDAAHLLFTKKISGVLVVDDQKTVVGILSEKDLFRVLYPFYSSFYEHPESYTDEEQREHKVDEIKNHPIHSFMKRDIHRIDPNAPILKAGALMLAKHISRLPVFENGVLVGIVTRSHIYKSVLKQNFSWDT